MSRTHLLGFSSTLLIFGALIAADSLPEARSLGEQWWAHVKILADDKMEGRNTGSEGYRRAAAYVAGEFERDGLKPAGTSGYMQPIAFVSRRIVESESSLSLVREGKAELLSLGEDANFSMRIEAPASVEAPVVFVGYGLSAPEMHYSDLAGLDLKGKVVMYLSGGPATIPGPLRSHYQSASERWKSLKQAGAIGVIAVQNPKSMDIPWSRATLARLAPSMSLADPSLDETPGQKLAVVVNPASADKFLAGSGHSFQELLQIADAGKPLPAFALPVSIRAKVHFESERLESPNVVAMWPGADPQLKEEYVIFSAHLDHVGVGEPINGDRIYNGAMDNASGVACLLELARSFHESKTSFRRSVLFVVVTAEEKGLLGSKFFAHHPTVKPENIVADLNNDMFLPLFPLRALTVEGLEESDLGDMARQAAESIGVGVQADPEPERNVFIRSDQYSFIRQGIPSLAFKVGYQKGTPEAAIAKQWLTDRYHAPSDDLQQPVDITAAGKFNLVMRQLAGIVANRTERPHWKQESFFRRYAN